MAAAEQPLSKQSFGNNADLLVFPDRHEYRTRSRVGYFAIGIIALSAAALGVWLSLEFLVFFPARDGDYTSTDWIMGCIAAAIFLPCSGFFSLIAWGAFRTNPWIVISPAGVEFHNRLGFLRLRAENFLVEFADIEGVETKRWGDRGKYEMEAHRFRHALKIYTEDRGGLLLRWDTFESEEAARFEAAFLASMQEMATRFLASRLPSR